ncbi:YggT family protein [Streptococcus sp. zg-JUN1979]|uniref:YggT family protein n=1 Tax=Streptococcus sp. zg-JUN1979 TaxID=3391450 RepID=UPI0039A5101A
MGLLLYIISILLRVIEIYSYVLVAYALLSWFPGAYSTWLGRLIVNIAEPLVRPFRRFNLQFMGLDWTIVVVMIALNVLSRLLIGLLGVVF